MKPTFSPLSSLPPLSLYVHLPWCVKKCPYCDFNSHEARGGIPEDAYVDALILDLEQSLPLIWGREIRSVFFGGGTPSLFSAAALDRLLMALRARLKINPFAEITLEANPGTFEAEKFLGFREAGINRLSVGIQSLNARHLQALGRIHDRDEALAALAIARATFENFNLDLMYALPGQTVAEAIADVREAVALGPTHLSAYHLTIEPNTAFYHRPPAVPDDDTSAAMQEAIEVELAQAGFLHYETSAFARPGRQSQHNLNYWQYGDYLGIGAGAHGKLSFHDRIIRQVRQKHPQAYMEAVGRGTHILREEPVADADRPFEFMMNALRLLEGVDAALFAERTGLQPATLDGFVRQAAGRGLLLHEGGRIRPTLMGQRFLNDLLEMLLEAPLRPVIPIKAGG